MSRPIAVTVLHRKLLQIMAALTAPTSVALTCRVEEPSTASITDFDRTIRSPHRRARAASAAALIDQTVSRCGFCLINDDRRRYERTRRDDNFALQFFQP